MKFSFGHHIVGQNQEIISIQIQSKSPNGPLFSLWCGGLFFYFLFVLSGRIEVFFGVDVQIRSKCWNVLFPLEPQHRNLLLLNCSCKFKRQSHINWAWSACVCHGQAAVSSWRPHGALKSSLSCFSLQHCQFPIPVCERWSRHSCIFFLLLSVFHHVPIPEDKQHKGGL